MTYINSTHLSEGRPALEQPTSVWTRNFILLCLANLSLFISMQVLTPTLPMYIKEIGGDQKDIGYVMAAFTLGAMLMRPVAGWLVDSFGRKKIMLLGIGLGLLVSMLYKFAANVSIMIIIRGFHGLTYGLISTAIATMVADSLPVTRFSEGIGYFGLTSSLSLALAPVIGFWLVGRSGFHLLFLAVIFLSALAFVCSLPVRSTHTPTGAPNLSLAEVWSNLIEKSALPAAVVMFFIALSYGSVFSYIALYAAERGIANIGIFFTADAVAMLISRPLAGRWADKGGINKVLFIGHLGLLIGILAIALSHSLVGFFLAGATFGLGFGFCVPTFQALAVRHAPAHKRGAATGTFLVTVDLGIGIGTIFWGYVAAVSSYQMMYFASLLPVTLAGLTYYRLKSVR